MDNGLIPNHHIDAPHWDDTDFEALEALLRARVPLFVPDQFLAGDLGLDHHPPFVGPEKQGRAASVLMPLIEGADGYHLLFTQRTEHLSAHPGQISFPGGRQENEDKDTIATALRETAEEVGIGAEHIHVLGDIGLYKTFNGFHITPVLAHVETGYQITADPFEVADVFEVPLRFLLARENHQHLSKEFRGVERHYYAMPYGERYIWGVTAGILVKLSQTLYAYVEKHR